jgi:HEAT repeat protein
MKSSFKQLEDRGYANDDKIESYSSCNHHELIQLLKNGKAVERTIAAKILGNKKKIESLRYLCESLKTEKKLYVKIALCEAIEQYGKKSLTYLKPLIGVIGNNQHTQIKIVDIKKKSFPLPRDIVARIIIRIGCEALPFLEEILEQGTYKQKLEAIDAIGHIAFTSHDNRSDKLLIRIYTQNKADVLVKWKIVRAFQSFNSEAIIKILKTEEESKIMELKKEARRSLLQIEKRNARHFI